MTIRRLRRLRRLHRAESNRQPGIRRRRLKNPPATAAGTDLIVQRYSYSTIYEPAVWLFTVCCLPFALLSHHELFVVVEAFEDVAHVVDGFEAATETKLHHCIARVLLR
jgi:hypothetical protein